MARQISNALFRNFVYVQTGAILLVGCTWFYFRTAAYLAGPPDPDTYAWSWSFQAIVFTIIYLPMFLAMGTGLAVLEYLIVRLYYGFIGASGRIAP